MTTTGTPTTETLSSPPPVGPRQNAVTAAAGLMVVAAVTLTPWLLNNGSQTETGPFMPTSAAASPHQARPTLDQAAAGSNARSIARPAAYVRFCQNSPALCAPPPPPLSNTGYIRFCWNSPTLCTTSKPS
jgi:hypothetical protein